MFNCRLACGYRPVTFKIPFPFMQRCSLIWLTAILALTTGCSDVTFKDPVPLNRKVLNQFPKAWHGTWEETEGDIYTISASEFALSDSSARPVQLGPSFLLKRFQGYLVLNQKDDNDRWEVILAKRKKNRISLYQFDASNDTSVAVWEAVLGSSMSQKSGPSDDANHKSYVLSPANNLAFRQLIVKGGLTEFHVLTRTTN